MDSNNGSTEGYVPLRASQMCARRQASAKALARGTDASPYAGGAALCRRRPRPTPPPRAQRAARLAKTDRVDAQVLSHFGEVIRLRLVTSDDAAREELSGLEARRQQLLEMVTAEKNRLELAQPKVARGIRQHLGWLQKEVKQPEKEIQERLRSHAEWSPTVDILRSVPGVGPVLSAAIIADSPNSGERTGARSPPWSEWPR